VETIRQLSATAGSSSGIDSLVVYTGVVVRERGRQREPAASQQHERPSYSSQQDAFASLVRLSAFPPIRVGQSRACRVLEDFADAIAGLCRTLYVLNGADAFADFFALFGSDRLLGGFAKLFDGALVEAEILLAANENNRKARAEVQDLGDPLFLNIVKRIWRIDGEADQNDMGIGV